MTSRADKLKHLQWAIDSRSKNLQWSLRLLILLEESEEEWKTKKYSRAAQDLVAIAFSLWRAAFLANKTGRRVEVFSQAKSFLEKLVEDNAISYVQDKASKEWTFNYYTRVARSSLRALHQFWPDVAPEYSGAGLNPADRWDYCHQMFEQVVVGFENLFAHSDKKHSRAKLILTKPK